MPATQSLRRAGLALLLAAFATAGLAQATKPAAGLSAYEPISGQEGKDVVWVPTSQALVDKMLDLAGVTKDDFVMDLGSGDGRTVITAAKRGARALGVEYNPDLVALSKRNAQKEGVSGRATFVNADLFETDISQATVITMFLLPELNIKLRPRILALKPGTRIVSNSFTMGDWKEDERATLTQETGCNTSWCTALFWIVPARVEGTHKLPQGEVTFKQHYQELAGSLASGGTTYALEGKVRGEEVSFTSGGREYRGRMNGRRFELNK
ncbi:MAG: class I SAM-dependent methyltransferase [Betaproteobacteria bacterium]|nr:class I SAM-dependent methyltransferase [Betaproteobacteria bacterium]